MQRPAPTSWPTRSSPGTRARAISLAEDLRDRGADIMYVLFAMLRKVSDTRIAWAVLEEGGSTQGSGRGPGGSRLEGEADQGQGRACRRRAARASLRPPSPISTTPSGGRQRGRRHGADADGGGRRAGGGLALAAPALIRAARDFLRAALLRCSAPCSAALSILETSARCSASMASASPDSTARSRRRK